MAVTSIVKRPPLGTTSWSFIDTKPSIIMYDVEHTHVLTIGNISKKLQAGKKNLPRYRTVGGNYRFI